MNLAGVPVEDGVVRELTARLDQPLRGKLERALLFRATVVGLSWEERSAVLAALETGPPGLEGLQDLLLSHEAWRLRQRLL
jgi:hypothetical protein